MSREAFPIDDADDPLAARRKLLAVRARRRFWGITALVGFAVLAPIIGAVELVILSRRNQKVETSGPEPQARQVAPSEAPKVSHGGSYLQPISPEQAAVRGEIIEEYTEDDGARYVIEKAPGGEMHRKFSAKGEPLYAIYYSGQGPRRSK